MVQRPKGVVWDPWPFGADVFEFLGRLSTLLFPWPLLWVASMAPVLRCDLPSGGCSSGPGTSVWHPDCRVRCWAEEGPTDNVAAQPCQEPLPLGCRTEAAQPSKLLVHWKWARGSCLVRIWAGWESFVQIWNPGVWDLVQSSRPALEA